MDLNKPIPVRESLAVLVDGFERFQQRQLPLLRGVSFTRVAGQACCLDSSRENNSRAEIKRILEATKPGGVFLILGHSGIAKCGAVAARRAQLASRLGEEPEHVVRLLGSIPSSVQGVDSPMAEMLNARHQAERILVDTEFGKIIRRKNITVVYAVSTGTALMDFVPVNRPDWNANELFAQHPQLYALALRMQHSIGIAAATGTLGTHYAHSIVLYDPLSMRKVLDPHDQLLEVGGICCVDARVVTSTPDGPHALFEAAPNQIFGVTINVGMGGTAPFSFDDLGSMFYAFGHVSGVNSLAQHGEKGNGHVVILTMDTSLEVAGIIKGNLLRHPTAVEATSDGATITLMGFDGQRLRLVNAALELDLSINYEPRVPLLSV